MRLVSSEEPGPDLEKIKSVARGGDFGPPMHFVGREEAIEGILDACRKVRAGSCYRRTQLVTGGSGAGCTSLLVEIRRRLEEDDSNDAPRVGFIPSHGFSRPEEAIGNILNKLEPPMPGKRWSVPSGVPFQQAAGPLSQQARDSMSVLLVDNADRVTGDSTNAAGWPISSLLRELRGGRRPGRSIHRKGRWMGARPGIGRGIAGAPRTRHGKWDSNPQRLRLQGPASCRLDDSRIKTKTGLVTAFPRVT